MGRCAHHRSHREAHTHFSKTYFWCVACGVRFVIWVGAREWGAARGAVFFLSISFFLSCSGCICLPVSVSSLPHTQIHCVFKFKFLLIVCWHCSSVICWDFSSQEVDHREGQRETDRQTEREGRRKWESESERDRDRHTPSTNAYTQSLSAFSLPLPLSPCLTLSVSLSLPHPLSDTHKTREHCSKFSKACFGEF